MWYNLTRTQAAEILWISTRTLDRWIRKWLLSYEKRGNKVYLEENEIKNYNKHKEVQNIVFDASTTSNNKTVSKNSLTPKVDTKEIVAELWKQLDQSMGKFLEVLAEKDKKLEEKNQIIFALQQKVGELEVKLKNMVALPLYQEEKKELILEKENLKIENKILEDKLKKEKIRNIALVGFLVILVLIIIFAWFRI